MSQSNNKYGNVLFCTADPTKNAGNIRDYFIQNSDRFIGFHFFPGYSSEHTYIEVFEFGKKIQKKQFKWYHGRNNILKNTFDYFNFCYTLLFVVKRDSFIIVNAPFFCTLYFLFEFLNSEIHLRKKV